MDIYKFSLYLGFTGLAAMALLGASHIAQSMGHGGHGVGGHAGHGHSDGAGHGAHLHSVPQCEEGHAVLHHGLKGGSRHVFRGKVAQKFGSKISSAAWSLLSPRVLFSLLLGFGATGMLLPRTGVSDTTRFVLAICGGFGFENLLVAPLWNFIFRFASNPARTLESAVFEEARAVTNFDAGGNGLIAIDLDGQVVQVLGTLASHANPGNERVRAGDRLFIEAVDTHRNSCTVSLIDS